MAIKKEEVEAPSESTLGINETAIPENSTVPGKKLLSSPGEREKLNIELEEPEARFKLVLEKTFDGILLADISTKMIKYSNPAICAMLGYSHEELQYMSIQQIHPEDDWPFVLSEFEALSSGNKSMATNIPCVCKDGKVIYADISVSGLVFEGVKCSAGFFRDVTEKRKSEDAIRFSEKKFRSLFTAMAEGVALHELVRDRDGEIVDYRIIDVNPSYEKNTGIPREKAVGSLASELYGFEPPPYLEEFSGVAVTGEPYFTEFYFAPLERSFRISVVSPGNNMFATVLEDVTEKKRAERNLKESTDELQKLAAIVKYSSELVNLSTLDGKMIFLNEAGGKMLGIDPDKVKDFNILDVIPKHLLGKAKDELLPKLLKGETWEGELQYINLKTKKLIDVHAMIFPIQDTGTDKPKYFANVSLDISEQKILQEKLRHSEKMEAIGHLAGGIAHDFNNQLLGIMGFAEILREKMQDIEMKKDAESIIVGAQRAADLVSDLLAFSRKGKYLSVSVDVHKIIEEVSSILERSIDKKIQIRKKLSSDSLFIYGDPTQIQNALLNLAINARDALPEGGIIIFTAEREHIDRSKLKGDFSDIISDECIKISVLDNGTGIGRETMKHIFEPFFTTKELGKGTGMGLASVYGTVKVHKGAINVESEPGKGSRFDLYFPVHADNETENTTSDIPVGQGNTHKILFADDEPIVRNLISKMVESLGCKVVACSNGVEALKYYRESWQEIDLVILDMIMPKKSGKDTYLEMCSINKNIRAIIISGYSFDGVAQSLIDAGIRGFLQKPFSKTELSQKISEALK